MPVRSPGRAHLLVRTREEATFRRRHVAGAPEQVEEIACLHRQVGHDLGHPEGKETVKAVHVCRVKRCPTTDRSRCHSAGAHALGLS